MYVLMTILFVISANASDSIISIQLPSPSSIAISRWEKFHRFVGKDIENFTAQHLNSVTQDMSAVFYPFGGADVLYPLYLYPAVKDIVLAGLESPGCIDDFKELDPEAAFSQLESLLKRSFFITTQMSQQLSKKTGVISPILLQLKLLGVNEVHLSLPDLPFAGVKIKFKHNNIEKTVTYYQIDFHDTKDNSHFFTEMKNQHPHFACLLKAASYIPHQIGFQKIRDFIVHNSKIIIQDDTGIPLKKLKRFFNVKLFGSYTKPYGAEFKCYGQPDLAALSRKNNNILPFCFGYGCGRQPSLLILAVH